jgi:hypothetical protein
MAFFRFQVDSSLTSQEVLQRIHVLAREAPGFWQSIKESFGARRGGGPPFIGKVEGDTFRLSRDIHYRNSFLPQVRGRVISSPTGSRVLVTMHLHPVVGAFMLFWLGGVAIGAWAAFTSPQAGSTSTLITAGMFVFGVVLTLGAFYPEAFKARRLLERGIGVSGRA